MDGNREFRIIRARKLIMAGVRQNYAAYLLAGGRRRVYLLRCVRLRAGLGRVPFHCWLLLLLLCVPGRPPSPVRKELRRNSKSDGYKFPFLRILLALGPLLVLLPTESCLMHRAMERVDSRQQVSSKWPEWIRMSKIQCRIPRIRRTLTLPTAEPTPRVAYRQRF